MGNRVARVLSGCPVRRLNCYWNGSMIDSRLPASILATSVADGSLSPDDVFASPVALERSDALHSCL